MLTASLHEEGKYPLCPSFVDLLINNNITVFTTQTVDETLMMEPATGSYNMYTNEHASSVRGQHCMYLCEGILRLHCNIFFSGHFI